MKNYITVLVLTFLVIVQGSPSFEEVLEYNKELDNKDSVQLTYDSINLKRNDNVDAIGTIPVSDKFKRFKHWKDVITPAIESTVIMNTLKHHGKIMVNSENKVQHPVDDAGKISDIIVAITRLPLYNPKDLKNAIPKLVSVEKDLNGNVQCHDFICNIILLGFDMILGYDAANSGLYLKIEFLKMKILHVKVPIWHVQITVELDNGLTKKIYVPWQHTVCPVIISSKRFSIHIFQYILIFTLLSVFISLVSGILYCEKAQMPKYTMQFCIHADNVQLSDKRACLDLGFTFLGYTHTFPDICLHG